MRINRFVISMFASCATINHPLSVFVGFFNWIKANWVSFFVPIDFINKEKPRNCSAYFMPNKWDNCHKTSCQQTNKKVVFDFHTWKLTDSHRKVKGDK